MSVENYYEILGVPENASQDEIKKAYRKKAVEHHPDKGGSEEVFKKIASAYDTLGDERKRKDYDNRKNNPFQGGGFNDFGGFNPFEEFFGNQFQKPRKRRPPDKVIEVHVDVLESYLGVEKLITYIRNLGCNTCSGNGGERNTCTTCNGEGHVVVRHGTGIFVQISRHICNNCKGLGYFITKACYSCSGKGTIPTTETMSIRLPHGVDEGQIFKIQTKGDFSNGVYGDLDLKIKLKSENNFEKNGNDLIYNLFFNYEDLKKNTIEIPHPDGNMQITLPMDIDTSKPMRVKSKGFNINGRGDLFIRQFVKFRRDS